MCARFCLRTANYVLLMLGLAMTAYAAFMYAEFQKKDAHHTPVPSPPFTPPSPDLLPPAPHYPPPPHHHHPDPKPEHTYTPTTAMQVHHTEVPSESSLHPDSGSFENPTTPDEVNQRWHSQLDKDRLSTTVTHPEAELNTTTGVDQKGNAFPSLNVNVTDVDINIRQYWSVPQPSTPIQPSVPAAIPSPHSSRSVV